MTKEGAKQTAAVVGYGTLLGLVVWIVKAQTSTIKEAHNTVVQELRTSREDQKEQLEKLQKSFDKGTESNTKCYEVMNDLDRHLEDLAVQTDDVGDEIREMNKSHAYLHTNLTESCNRVLEKVWQEHRTPRPLHEAPASYTNPSPTIRPEDAVKPHDAKHK